MIFSFWGLSLLCSGSALHADVAKQDRRGAWSLERGIALKRGQCLEVAKLNEAVARYLKKPPADPLLAIAVSEDDGTVTLTVNRARRSPSVRQISIKDALCEDATEAVAISIALAIDAALAEPPAPERAPTPVRPSELSEGPVRLQVAAQAAMAVAVLSAPVFAIRPSIATELLPGVSVGLSGLFTMAARELVGTGSVDTALYAGSVGGCVGMSQRAPVGLRGCVGLWAGTVRAEGFDFAQSHSGTGFWSATSLGGEVGVGLLGPLRLRGNVDLVAPVSRSEIVVLHVDGKDVVGGGPVGLVGSVGVELNLF